MSHETDPFEGDNREHLSRKVNQFALSQPGLKLPGISEVIAKIRLDDSDNYTLVNGESPGTGIDVFSFSVPHIESCNDFRGKYPSYDDLSTDDADRPPAEVIQLFPKTQEPNI